MTTLYTKQGRRYVAWGHADRYDHDTMRAGEFRLTYCARDGERRYTYGVTPDTAGFVAAAEIARDAMERAINDRAIAGPQLGAVTPYTKRQLAIIEQFRRDMAEAGGLTPTYWQHATARELSEAAIDAVRGWRP